jgi:hypothetical protein
MENANLARPFLIEFNGRFVAHPPMDNSMEDLGGRIPAKVGDRKDAAVFTLRNGYLSQAGPNQEMTFGRFKIEPLAFMPMPVYWMLNRDMAQPCTYSGEESSPKLFESSGTLHLCNHILAQSSFRLTLTRIPYRRAAWRGEFGPCNAPSHVSW